MASDDTGRMRKMADTLDRANLFYPANMLRESADEIARLRAAPETAERDAEARFATLRGDVERMESLEAIAPALESIARSMRENEERLRAVTRERDTLARLVADALRLVEQSPSIPLDERVHTTSMWAQRARAATDKGAATDG